MSADETYVSPYFVDSDGNEYESYAMSWRYLGVYTPKCSWYSSTTCNPKLLWAAYVDLNYSGGNIGEYQFYDWEDGAWDQSTCQTSRCAKMDCHDPNTFNWNLVGVYKESVDFDNDAFFEQLFKHQGYCVWSDNSDYEFMQEMREGWLGTCQKIGSYYIGTKPSSGGDMSYGVYRDSKCLKETKYSYDDVASSSSSGDSWSSAFEKWNSLMMGYKICQPCRAYSRSQNYDNDFSYRFLAEENDGQGAEEKYGFNCYDDAGYRNCNQCFKFETHTDMEVASSSDLKTASKQGTILAIKYLDGVTYGSGYVGDVTSYGTGSSSGYYSKSGSSGYYSKSGSSGYYSAYSTISYASAGAGVVVALMAAVFGIGKLRRRIIAREPTLNEALRSTLSG